MAAEARWKTENVCDLQMVRFSLEAQSKRTPSDIRISAEVTCLRGARAAS